MPLSDEQLHAVDRAALAIMTTAIGTYEPDPQRSRVMEHLATPKVLSHAAARMSVTADYDVAPSAAVERGVRLIGLAHDQAFDILEITQSMLPRTVNRDPEEVAKSLRKSLPFGIIMGSISSREERKDSRRSSDYEVIDDLKRRRDTYLAHDVRTNRVGFTPQGLAFINKHRRPNTGCPVMNKFVTVNGNRVKLFDLGYTEFTEDYIAERVMPRRFLSRLLKSI